MTRETIGQLAVVAKNVLDLRSEAGRGSEMVSQAILGQPVWIESGQDDWFYVRTRDGYHGWAEARWIVSMTYRQAYASGHAVAVVKPLFSDIHSAADSNSDIITKCVVSTELEMLAREDDWIRIRLPDGREAYIEQLDVKLVDRAASMVIVPPSGDKLISTAKRFIGVPYLWGGTTPFGIDCSGFVQLVHHIRSLTLPRDAWMQAADSRAIPVERANLKAGDLVFFAGGSDAEKITHVGLAMGGGKFIHSAGGVGVAITDLDEPRYKAIYSGARRIRCESWESGMPVEHPG